MTPQLMTALLTFFFDRRSRRTGQRKKGFFARTAYGMATLFASVAAVAAYFGIPPEKLEAWLHGKAAVVLEKVEKHVEQKLDLPFGPAPTSGGSGAVRCFFTSPPGNPADTRDAAHACAGFIAGAQQTLDVAGFEINNKVIVDALVAAKRRGIRVRAVTDTDYVDETGPAAFKAAGIPLVDDNRSALMHNKFIVRDGSAVWTGSMNFTENCAYRNNNNGVILEVAAVAENYATKFQWMFEQKCFGKKPSRDARTPHPVVTLADGTVIETYFAPHDECADHLTRAVREAKMSVDFLAFSFTHKGIGAAVAERSAAGVRVRGVFEKTQASNSYTMFHSLQKLGLPVYLDANPRNMHHKVMLLDKSVTVTGSFNFSEGADKSNDENMLIIRRNPAVSEAFAAEFERVYGQATGLGK